MSLLKYMQGEKEPNIHFGRARHDGMPFRGPSQLLPEDEYQARTEVVSDGHADVFDLSIPEQKAQLEQIFDRAANGWYAINRMREAMVPQPDGSIKVFVYCLWTVPFRQLAGPELG